MNQSRNQDLLDLVETEAQKIGLDIISVTDLTPLRSAEKRLKVWQAEGYAAEMDYMLRAPEELCSPLRNFPEAQSVLVVGLRYESRMPPARPAGFGRVARYAWGSDYHKVIPKRLTKLVQSLELGLNRKIKYRASTDALPLLERALAERAGLGFVGKNTMLIKPGLGSYFFLAELFWDLALEPKVIASSGTCGTCSRCLTSCPSKAIVAPHQLDARRCISYLTIEKRGMLSLKEREYLGEWIFGCDVCQEVCPFNHTANKAEESSCLAEFAARDFPGPHLSLERVLALRTDEEFRKLFAGTAILRTKRQGLLRNAAIVAANTRHEAAQQLLQEALEDSDSIIRAHALWALAQLGQLSSITLDRAAKDPAIEVREELKNVY